MKPAIEIKTSNLGKVIATPGEVRHLLLERREEGRRQDQVHRPCAVAWPPVYVKGKVQKHIKGVMATFGTIKRGSKLQLTVNGLPAYTYHNDPKGVVLCDNVDGWFAVRPK